MKKVVGLAAAGLFAVAGANAGQITTLNSDISVLGAVTAAYNLQDTDHFLATGGKAVRDYFTVNNVAIALTKPAQEGGLGFTAAIAHWEAPTVVASSMVVNDNGLIGWGQGNGGNIRVWKAFTTYKPVKELSIDAGLLWSMWGEKPVTFLNPHITRGVLFTANPVIMAGARAHYDAGVAKLYVGTGKVGAQLLQPKFNTAKNYVELGLNTDLKQVGIPSTLGLHVYDEQGGRNIYALTAGFDVGTVATGVEILYATADKKIKTSDNNAYGVALCGNIKPMPNVQLPVRIEYASTDKNATKVGKALIAPIGPDNNVWTFTVTPTYNPTKNTFIRGEISYVTSDNKIFVNDKGNSKDSRTTASAEFGFMF